MPMIAERGRESDGEWHLSQSSAFRCGHVAVPVGSLDADLPFAEIAILVVLQGMNGVRIRAGLLRLRLTAG